MCIRDRYKAVWFNTAEDNGDLLGRQYISENRTKYAIPEFFPDKENGKRGILVVEEVNSIPPHIVETLKSLISERKIGDYVLPDGWLLFGTSNPHAEDTRFNTEQYNVIKHDGAISARLVEIPVQTSLNDWFEYTREVHPDLGMYLFDIERGGEDVFKIASPREFTVLNSLLLRCNFTPQETRVMTDAVIKNEDFALAFASFVENKDARPLTVKEILENPSGSLEEYKTQINEGNHAFVYYTFMSLSNYIKGAEYVETKKGEWKIDSGLFSLYQAFCRITPADILINGLRIAMENLGYASQFQREDPLFEELAKRKKEIMAEGGLL